MSANDPCNPNEICAIVFENEISLGIAIVAEGQIWQVVEIMLRMLLLAGPPPAKLGGPNPTWPTTYSSGGAGRITEF